MRSTPFIRSAHFDRVDDSALCFEIDEYVVWNPGDRGNDVYSSIRNSVSVVVDDEMIDPNHLDVTAYPVLIARYDEHGQFLGDHGGGVAVCFDVTSLSAGSHMTQIGFRSTSGQPYVYEYPFNLEP